LTLTLALSDFAIAIGIASDANKPQMIRPRNGVGRHFTIQQEFDIGEGGLPGSFLGRGREAGRQAGRVRKQPNKMGVQPYKNRERKGNPDEQEIRKCDLVCSCVLLCAATGPQGN
jgi:hypothetical protein